MKILTEDSNVASVKRNHIGIRYWEFQELSKIYHILIQDAITNC